MSPIDRVAQRARAFTVLGVSASATVDDIRQAYRKLAFDKHPDRNPECSEEFARIAEAYRFISDNAAELGIKAAPAANRSAEPAVTPRTVSRPRINPRIKATETTFDNETLDECQALLDAEGGPGTLHVATAVYRVGRNLTYYAPTGLAPGRNEIVVPTGMLNDSRRVLPKIIAFEAVEATGGLFQMDLSECEEHFPGARSIKIRFAQA